MWQLFTLVDGLLKTLDDTVTALGGGGHTHADTVGDDLGKPGQKSTLAAQNGTCGKNVRAELRGGGLQSRSHKLNDAQNGLAEGLRYVGRGNFRRSSQTVLHVSSADHQRTAVNGGMCRTDAHFDVMCRSLADDQAVGGAQVSEKHAGFVVNRGAATAADMVELCRQVQHKIMETNGVLLEPEVRFIGEF